MGMPYSVSCALPMLLVGKHAQRRASVAQRGVLVFLHAVEFANDVAAVQACPKEIDPERSLAVHGLGQSHLQPRQRKTLLDHRGAGKRLAAAFALRVGAVHCPDGVPRACVPVADPAELGDEGAGLLPVRRSALSATASACPKRAVLMQSNVVRGSDVTRSPCRKTNSSRSTTCHRMVPVLEVRFALLVATWTSPNLSNGTDRPNATAADSWQNVQSGCRACQRTHQVKHALGRRDRAPVRGARVHAPRRSHDLSAFDLPLQDSSGCGRRG